MSRRYITTDVTVEVDVDVHDVIGELNDDQLADFGLYRTGNGSTGAVRVCQAVLDFHESNHSGLINGCSTEPCASLDYDAAELVRVSGRTP